MMMFRFVYRDGHKSPWTLNEKYARHFAQRFRLKLETKPYNHEELNNRLAD